MGRSAAIEIPVVVARPRETSFAPSAAAAAAREEGSERKSAKCLLFVFGLSFENFSIPKRSDPEQGGERARERKEPPVSNCEEVGSTFRRLFGRDV